MTQRDYLKTIAELSEKHPELAISFMVDSEELSESQYTRHEICNVCIELNLIRGDIGYSDEDTIADILLDELIYCDQAQYEAMSEEEVDTYIDNKMAELPKFINVYTRASSVR